MAIPDMTCLNTGWFSIDSTSASLYTTAGNYQWDKPHDVARYVKDKYLYQPMTALTGDPWVSYSDSSTSATATTNLTFTIPTSVHWRGLSYTITVDPWHTAWVDGRTEAQRKRDEIRDRLFNWYSRKRKALSNNVSPAEQVARDTLRLMITEQEYRRYLTNGFIVVKSPTNLWYQIFAHQENTRVYFKGEKVASLCIHTSKECPPTDHVINIKALVELDESQIWLGSNIHSAKKDHPIIRPFTDMKRMGRLQVA